MIQKVHEYPKHTHFVVVADARYVIQPETMTRDLNGVECRPYFYNADRTVGGIAA